jgi:hypothetical protein
LRALWPGRSAAAPGSGDRFDSGGPRFGLSSGAGTVSRSASRRERFNGTRRRGRFQSS